jgi:DNA-directed RNA polymerase specialized sigma24 family protein
MSKKSYWQRVAQAGHDELALKGSDEEVLAWAAKDGLTPTEFESWLAQADQLSEYACLQAEVRAGIRAYPDGVQQMLADLEADHDRLLRVPLDEADEPVREQEGTRNTRWRIACTRMLWDGLSDQQQEAALARIRRPEFAHRVTATFIDEAIESGRADDRGAVPVLREYFEELANGKTPSADSHAALIARFDKPTGPLQRPAVADEVTAVLEDRFLLTGGYRRALLHLPEVAAYLRTTSKRAAARNSELDAETGGVSSPVPMELDPDDDDEEAGHRPRRGVEPEAAERTGDTVEGRLTVEAVHTAFLPGLPDRMRADFLAVRVDGHRTIDVARESGRTAAAVSKNVAEASRRLRNFLAGRG